MAIQAHPQAQIAKFIGRLILDGSLLLSACCDQMQSQNRLQLHAIFQSKDSVHGMTKDKRSGKLDSLSTGSEESSTSKIPHDKFFRAIFEHTRYCIDLFRLALTEAEFKAFDWRTLSNDTDLVFTSNWSERKPDLVVSVNWKRSGKRLQLVSVIEHKSKKDSDVLLQLHEYCAVIMRAQRRPVLPIVVYNGFRRKWRKPLQLHDSLVKMPPELKSMFGANIPNFEPRIVNLRDLAIPGQIRGFVSEPALYMLAAIWSSSSRMLERLFRISASMSFTDRSDLIPSTVDYFLSHHPEYTVEDIVRIEQTVVTDKGKRIMQEAIFSWERREEIGRQKGIQEGIQEGSIKIAKKMLAKGFEIDTICDLTDLTPDELEQLRNRLD